MLNDSVASMRRFIELMTPISDLADGGSWHLDLAQCRYLGPDAAALVLASVLEAKLRNQDWSVALPTEPEKLAAFCVYSGLRHHLEGAPAPDPNRPGNETSPLRVIKHATYSDPDPIIGLVRGHMEISRDIEDYLGVCIREAVQNVEDHASSRIGAVMCARYMTQSHQIRVAIVDRGLGILTTLRRRFPETADAAQALRLVVKGGYSSMSRVNNLGVGISNLCNIVSNLGGDFFAITDNAVAVRAKNRWSYEIGTSWFKGTAIFFTLPVIENRHDHD